MKRKGKSKQEMRREQRLASKRMEINRKRARRGSYRWAFMNGAIAVA